MLKLENIPLRERKYAINKLAVVDAAVTLLKEKTFAEIMVKELCSKVMISEATFFNYFSKKSDLLLYISSLWMIELALYSSVKIGEESGIKLIEAVFDHTADKIKQQPRLMSEMFFFKAGLETLPEPPDITIAERLLAFPDFDEATDIPVTRLDTMLMDHLKLAVIRKELPVSINLKAVATSLLSAYYGVPLFAGRISPKNIKNTYKQQVSLLIWAIKHESPYITNT